MKSETRIVARCERCNTRTLVGLAAAGSTVKCHYCRVEISIPLVGFEIFRPPTIWQKAAAKSLGISIPEEISDVELEKLIRDAGGS